MRLPLYLSTARADAPNLIGVQDEGILTVPTVLVCPLRAGLRLTPLRIEVEYGDRKLIACPELIRPIRGAALRPMGRLSEELSHELLHRLFALFAH